MQQYLDFRKRDVELGHIVSGRLATIATHLQHWLSFIGKDTKLKELERTDCENYFIIVKNLPIPKSNKSQFKMNKAPSMLVSNG